jgi:hypothetical protein
MWSLTSPPADRISGPEKFCSSARKGFFNSIGTFRTCRDSLTMSAHGAKQTSRRKAGTSVFDTTADLTGDDNITARRNRE